MSSSARLCWSTRRSGQLLDRCSLQGGRGRTMLWTSSRYLGWPMWTFTNWSELCYGHFPDWFLEYYQIILRSLSFKPFDVMDIFQVGFYNLIRSYDDVLGWFLEYDDPGCFLEYDDDKDQIFKLETYFAGRLVGPRSDEGCRLMHTQPIGLFYLIIEKSDNLWQWYPGWFHWLIDGQLWNYKRLHGCHTILIHFR